MVDLKELGGRIAIIGCSSSGKSTLADCLSKKLNTPVYHLDLLAHHEQTNWTRRADDELVKAHSELLDQDEWIIEGNYSVCMSERLKQATSVIWLDANVVVAAFRYIKRSLFADFDRVGKLPGAKREFRLFMLKHILFTYPRNRTKYQALIEIFDGTVLKIPSLVILKKYYQYWELKCLDQNSS